jgi:hypothetical protein
MGISLSLVCSLRQVKVAATDSVLPLCAEWVRDHPKRRFAISGERKRYRDRVDRALVWALPCMGQHVHAFYADEGPPLREMITEAQCDMLDVALLKILKS